MANVNITIRMDEGIKKEANALFGEMGMGFTTAINAFARQCLREGRIPFDITTKPSAVYSGVEQRRIRTRFTPEATPETPQNGTLQSSSIC